MHSLVILAKTAIQTYITQGKIICLPDELSEEMTAKTGVFVSLKKYGQLRGCIGTFTPIMENVGLEVIRNAIAAATEDPRFNPLTTSELEEITYSVDVLSAPEKVNDLSELDCKRYGVIVVKGYKRGLLLPDLEGVNTVEEQLLIAKQKAGITPFENDVELYRFEVRRYH